MARGDPKLSSGIPDLRRGPTEQQTLDTDPPFKGGGRRADLPADYQQRAAADADYRANLARNQRQDREQLGIQREGAEIRKPIPKDYPR